MRVGFSRGILLRAALIGIFALILAAPRTASAQSADREQQQFADAWMAAVKSQDVAKVKALFHPATLACINDATRDFFDSNFKEELWDGTGLGTSYHIESVSPLPRPAPMGAFAEEGFAYPVEPTHQLQIEAETKDHRTMTILRFLAQANGRWYMVIPCPNAIGLTLFAGQKAETDRQMAEGAALAAGMPNTLRTEIEQLLAQGRWFDATDRYREATGADPATAVKVVNAMAAKK
jgi:hypothetical protein